MLIEMAYAWKKKEEMTNQKGFCKMQAEWLPK